MIRTVVGLFYFLLLLAGKRVASHKSNITALLITQRWPHEAYFADQFQQKFLAASDELGFNGTLLRTYENFEIYVGAWSIWPILSKLADATRDFSWVFIAEPFTDVEWTKLHAFTSGLNADDELLLGRALQDNEPSIIHHYYGFMGTETNILYPDFAAGLLISRGAFLRIANAAPLHDRSDFTIDAKHEFAKFIYDSTGIPLTNVPEFCLLPDEEDCITRYVEPQYRPNEFDCGPGITNEDVFYAVKTYTGNHKTRVVFVKRTWARQVKYVEFFSDSNDSAIPAINIGIENVERGHCKKTFAIMKYFVKNDEFKHIPWMVLADDDTLLNTEQLHKVINCLPSSTKVILGERYGFSYAFDGISGYNYPTGGAGMVISREAARFLAFSCECGETDPDDMIIGSCARRLNIPVLHSAAFHQAQRKDYSPLYTKRITPISFHKFEGIDPYEEYVNHLRPAKTKEPHTEL